MVVYGTNEGRIIDLGLRMTDQDRAALTALVAQWREVSARINKKPWDGVSAEALLLDSCAAELEAARKDPGIVLPEKDPLSKLADLE